MTILREENTAIQELNTLGFQPTLDVSENPLHALREALKEARYLVPLTNGGALVVQLCSIRTDLQLLRLITSYLDWPRTFCERL
jgi:hypothetical protein